MVSKLDKVKKQNNWLLELTRMEQAALDMCVTIDLENMVPEIVVCEDGYSRGLFDYWRVVLSSEPQGVQYSGGGRSLSILIRDKVSGGFLGVVALSDPPTYSSQLMEHLGWLDNNDARLLNQHRVCMMRRCLPVYEFGEMTGGKSLALMATSRDVIRVMELRYSFQYLLFVIRTLHGKGSQYNRLHSRGICFVDTDDSGKGFFSMPLRKKSMKALREGLSDFGKTNTYTLLSQTEYWKSRWLSSRIKTKGEGSGIITLDPRRYMLSNQLDIKKMRVEQL